jgi:hypothetical protein
MTLKGQGSTTRKKDSGRQAQHIVEDLDWILAETRAVMQEKVGLRLR